MSLASPASGTDFSLSYILENKSKKQKNIKSYCPYPVRYEMHWTKYHNFLKIIQYVITFVSGFLSWFEKS